MACLLGVQRSFEKAEVALLEVAGWELDDNTIRQLCHATAARARSGGLQSPYSRAPMNLSALRSFRPR